MIKCSPEAFAKCPNRLYCGSYPSECSFIEGSDCDKFNRSVEDGPKTNADRIRAMSDEELAMLLLDGCRGSRCEDHCYECRLKWLQQPAKE